MDLVELQLFIIILYHTSGLSLSLYLVKLFLLLVVKISNTINQCPHLIIKKVGVSLVGCTNALKHDILDGGSD